MAIDLRLDESTTVTLDSPGGRAGYQETSAADKIEANFDSVLQVVRAIASTTIQELSTSLAENPPSKVALSFGVRFGAEGNVIVAKASSEASFSIQLAWSPGTK